MPKITVGNIKIEMTVDEWIEFLKKTNPTEMAEKLEALAKTEKPTETPSP